MFWFYTTLNMFLYTYAIIIYIACSFTAVIIVDSMVYVNQLKKLIKKN